VAFAKGNKIGNRFRKGEAANPGGRPKIIGAIQELARQHTETALQALVDIVKDEKSPPAARVAAAAHILDRAYGKPPSSIEHTGSGVLLRVVTGILRAPDEPLIIDAEATEPDGSLH
jgi:hypothetical protein